VSPAIVTIVEGHAEVQALPVLIRRFIAEAEAYRVEVARPFRVKRNLIVKEGELERALQLAIRDRHNVGGVLVVLDADDDCPAQLGYNLAQRCRHVTHLPTAVVLANKELEAWFLGAKQSLRGVRGIRDDAIAPEYPERIRGAKERLSDNMVEGSRYLEIDDQPALAHEMDMQSARAACPSFNRFCHKVLELIGQMGLSGS